MRVVFLSLIKMDLVKPRSKIIFSFLQGDATFVHRLIVKAFHEILPLIHRSGIALDDVLLGQTQLRFRRIDADE